jgi:hypothetical protein
MGHYDFKKDHKIAVKTEQFIADLIMKANKGKIKSIQINDDNRYDLGILTLGGEFIKVEIKEDFTCQETGNVGVEFECRGKASGIAVSQADLYCYRIHEPNGDISIRLIETKALKNLIRQSKYHRIVTGGDEGSNSKNYLFKLSVFKDNSQLYYRERSK